MQPDVWDRLAAPFPVTSTVWRVAELSADERSARVRPQLEVEAILARLDQVVGVGGWSLGYRALGEGVIACELTIGGVAKAALAAPRPGRGDPLETAEAALARAGELFALRPPVDARAAYWVDYDPEAGEILHPPEARPTAPAASPAAAPTAAGDSAPPASEATAAEPVKPQGQQAIDRLVERLKRDGLGLEAARLLVAHGGYGKDPEAARELYASLRALLLEKGSATS